MSFPEGHMSDRDAVDKTAWVRAAVAEYEGPLVLYARRMLGDLDRARDVVQDVFLRLCEQDPGRIGARLRPWLFTVCRNRALDVRRKDKPMSQLADDAAEGRAGPDLSPPDILQRKEESSQVLQALATLPENQQEVVRLKFQHGLSYREISDVTQLSVSNVGFLLHVALKNMRARVTV